MRLLILERKENGDEANEIFSAFYHSFAKGSTLLEDPTRKGKTKDAKAREAEEKGNTQKEEEEKSGKNECIWPTRLALRLHVFGLMSLV